MIGVSSLPPSLPLHRRPPHLRPLCPPWSPSSSLRQTWVQVLPSLVRSLSQTHSRILLLRLRTPWLACLPAIISETFLQVLMIPIYSARTGDIPSKQTIDPYPIHPCWSHS